MAVPDVADPVRSSTHAWRCPACAGRDLRMPAHQVYVDTVRSVGAPVWCASCFRSYDHYYELVGCSSGSTPDTAAEEAVCPQCQTDAAEAFTLAEPSLERTLDGVLAHYRCRICSAEVVAEYAKREHVFRGAQPEPLQSGAAPRGHDAPPGGVPWHAIRWSESANEGPDYLIGRVTIGCQDFVVEAIEVVDDDDGGQRAADSAREGDLCALYEAFGAESPLQTTTLGERSYVVVIHPPD